MNLRESQTILSVLQAAFPGFYRGIAEDKLRNIIKLWQSMFADDEYAVVSKAVKALIATKIDDFPPTIGAVREQIAKITQPEQMSEMEAWSLVCKACRNGSHHSREEFDKLPEVIQQAVGSPDQLRVWAQMDENTVNSVISSNFMRTYRVKQQQQKERSMLTNDVREYLASVSETMKLENKEKGQLQGNKTQNVGLLPIGEMVSEMPEELTQQREAYQVPDDTSWEKMREEAMKSLATVGKSDGQSTISA